MTTEHRRVACLTPAWRQSGQSGHPPPACHSEELVRRGRRGICCWSFPQKKSRSLAGWKTPRSGWHRFVAWRRAKVMWRASAARCAHNRTLSFRGARFLQATRNLLWLLRTTKKKQIPARPPGGPRRLNDGSLGMTALSFGGTRARSCDRTARSLPVPAWRQSGRSGHPRRHAI